MSFAKAGLHLVLTSYSDDVTRLVEGLSVEGRKVKVYLPQGVSDNEDSVRRFGEKELVA